MRPGFHFGHVLELFGQVGNSPLLLESHHVGKIIHRGGIVSGFVTFEAEFLVTTGNIIGYDTCSVEEPPWRSAALRLFYD